MADSNIQGTLPCRRLAHGFTLLELLIAVAIAAILAALAMPSYRELMVRMNVSETTNDLIVALNAARSEAVKRGSDVTLSSVGGDWSAGWVLKPVVAAPSDPASGTLLQHSAVSDHYKVMAAGTLAGAAAGSADITFGATGNLKGGVDLFDLNVCRPSFSPGDGQSRLITVKSSGTISSQRDTSSSPAGSCA